MLTYRRDKHEPLQNLELFTAHNWGLIIYDEVHLLPAPVLRATAAIQARRRLGLTATLVREDGKEEDVFALIGPKRYDVPWKVLENRGYIAEAYCTEYRLPLPRREEIDYAHARKRDRFRIAAENPDKIELVAELIANHPDDSILVIGQFISQLERIAADLDPPPHHRQDTPRRAGTSLRRFQGRAHSRTGRFQSRQLRCRSARRQRADPGLRHLWLAPGRSATPGADSTPQSAAISLLYPRLQRDRRATFGINRQMFLVEQGYRYQIRYYA